MPEFLFNVNIDPVIALDNDGCNTTISLWFNKWKSNQHLSMLKRFHSFPKIEMAVCKEKGLVPCSHR